MGAPGTDRHRSQDQSKELPSRGESKAVQDKLGTEPREMLGLYRKGGAAVKMLLEDSR